MVNLFIPRRGNIRAVEFVQLPVPLINATEDAPHLNCVPKFCSRIQQSGGRFIGLVALPLEPGQDIPGHLRRTVWNGNSQHPAGVSAGFVAGIVIHVDDNFTPAVQSGRRGKAPQDGLPNVCFVKQGSAHLQT